MITPNKVQSAPVITDHDPSTNFNKCLSAGVFDSVFAYLDPNTESGAKGVLNLALASKDCRAAAQHSRLYPTGQAERSQTEASTDDQALEALEGRLPDLSALAEAQLTAERYRVDQQNAGFKQDNKLSLRGNAHRFHRFSANMPLIASRLRKAEVLFLKELEKNNNQWEKVREHGELVLSLKNQDEDVTQKSPLRLCQQNIFRKAVHALKGKAVTEPTAQSFSNWRKRDYITMMGQRNVKAEDTRYSVSILGTEAVPPSKLRQNLAKLVYVGLLPVNVARLVLSEIEKVRKDQVNEYF